MPVHVFHHPLSLSHNPGPGHPESSERLAAILDELRGPSFEGMICWREASGANEHQLLRAHSESYLELLREVADRGGGRLDADTVMGRSSYEAAVVGAGAAIEAAKTALAGQPAFAAIRPPGHHALRDAAMGFCLLNNVVIAARAALEESGAGRVLIVDWDVHHGNGTQAMVETDPRIRYVSLHQWPLYPGTGRADERGVGNIFNVPRPPGLARSTYVGDLIAAVAFAVDGWRPDLILLSAGFDAMAGDPLAGFTLEPEDYPIWVGEWRRMGVPMASVLEGGYVPSRIRRAAGEHVRALAE
ncbi:MAG: histone deacetylase [Gemmatimonadetes bacterium]|nr:histone deacetylase [Gemmatimonadota bacterium]